MILLFSGGLDSYIAWHYLGKPKTLYCDLGHRYASLEVDAVRRLIPTTIIDTRLNLADWEEKDAHIPLRNAFLIMIASHYDDQVSLVVQKGEMDLPDRSKWFFEKFEDILSDLRGQMQISSPFYAMTKTQMVQWYIHQGFSVRNLIATRSCFSPGVVPCGNCAACFRRWVAFTNNGFSEDYEQDITEYGGIQEYVTKMKAGQYDPVRTLETMEALKSVGVI
jgi:7-cyano-7-deazaguanine synthase in queuosine biosynthesis